jgi:Terpene synthase family 2, C-terminal metal binding
MLFKNIIFPRLSCPFPELVSPFAEAIHEHTLDWVRQYRLVNEDKAFQRLRLSKFGWLAARAYPHAPRSRLEIVSDWNTWLFILDDQCDECGLGKHPDQLSALHTRCLQTLCGRKPDPMDLPLVYALHDIYRRLQPLASQAWLARFAKSASEYFEATFWEAQNRFYKHWPDMASYVRMRPYTGGLYTDIDLIEITEQISLPCIVRSHPRLNQLVVITNNVVCWSNDIISLKKELAHGDMHNLVLIMQHESNCSLQESLNRVKRLIDNQIRRFLLFETQLPSFGERTDPDVARFVAVLRSWMRGNLDWAYESGRYETVTSNLGSQRASSFGKAAKNPWSIGTLAQIELSAES